MNILSSGLWILLLIPLRLLALVVHECSHGYISTKLGDPTPRIQGRLSLNPLVHLDPFGTLLMILTGFGWARPVEVNPMYYKDRKKGMALVALAGPMSNFILAFLFVLLNGIFNVIFYFLNTPHGLYSFVGTLCYYAATINLCFMVFNLIPIPPLDGSRILGMFLHDRTYYKLMELERYSLILIMVLSLTGAFSSIIGTGVSVFYSLIVNAINNILGFIVGIFI